MNTYPGNNANGIVGPACAEALRVLEQAGHEAWLVGGCVRDALLGTAPDDIDLATSAPWAAVCAAFADAGYPTYETGTAHGTVTADVDGTLFEITTYRTEGAYDDFRHPSSVEFVRTIEEDLARRDFTMNALAYHPDRGLCDPYGGQGDIAAKTIRAVGDARTRFGEDALRILRAVRFASQLGFSIEPSTLEGAQGQVDRLGNVSAERIAAELDKMLLGQHVREALLQYPEIIDYVLPEIAPMRNFEHRSPYHIYDVLEHTAWVVSYAPPNLLVRWAALFHDAGKPQSMTTAENGQRHYYGHPKLSAPLAVSALKRLKKNQKFIERVQALVLNHDAAIPAEPRPVKRLLNKLGGDPDLFFALCDLKCADAKAHAPEHQRGVQRSEELRTCLQQVLAANEAFSRAQLAINGTDLVARGVAQGPSVGRLLDRALDAVIDEKVENERAALLAFLDL